MLVSNAAVGRHGFTQNRRTAGGRHGNHVTVEEIATRLLAVGGAGGQREWAESHPRPLDGAARNMAPLAAHGALGRWHGGGHQDWSGATQRKRPSHRGARRTLVTGGDRNILSVGS